MTMQPTAADTADLETSASADAADQPEGDEDPQPSGVDLGSYIRGAMREELAAFKASQQSLNDRTYKAISDFGQRIESLAAQGVAVGEIRDLVDDLHALSVDPTEREKRKLERQIATLEREKATPAPTKPEPPQSADDATYELRFYNEVAPDLDDYGRMRGFTDEEMAAANWMQRLAAQGAPGSLDMNDPRSIRAYKDGMKKAVDALAVQKRNATRPRTSTPNVQTNGGAPVRDVDAYQKALKDGKPLPSAAEIDAMTRRYLTG